MNSRQSLHDAIDIDATLKQSSMRGRPSGQVEIALSNGQRAVSTQLHYIGLSVNAASHAALLPRGSQLA